MTAEQLEELLGKVTQGRWRFEYSTFENYAFSVCSPDLLDSYSHAVADVCQRTTSESNATLIALAPSLARRVIAAEKLVEALDVIAGMDLMGASAVAYNARRAYREASK